MSVSDRMAAALDDLGQRWKGRRFPKAFYLSQADWAEFTSVERPTVETVWGNNPPQPRTDPSFNNVPVRPSKSAGDYSSRLYDHSGYGFALPVDSTKRPTLKVVPELPADQVFSALDALSRTRALSDRESDALEAAMRGVVILTQREALRLVRP